MTAAWRWSMAALLTLGAIVTVGIPAQRSVPLRAPLASAVPAVIAGYAGQDITISAEEVRVAGVTNYVMRSFTRGPRAAGAGAAAFSVYVGYYDQQTQGKTIHSPKNCLPGAGWEPLASGLDTIATPRGRLPVNRYLLQRGNQQALVIYWYQGRGRVEANEYVVKWNLLRDAAIRGHSEEALVRVVIPLTESAPRAFDLGVQVAGAVIPALDRALPL